MRNTRNPLALAALLFAAGLAQAQTATSAPLTPSQQYAADSKQLEARYQSDLAMCNSEKESAGRMQCKRDAKTEYDKALASAKAKMTTATAPAAKTTTTTQTACADCGKVTAINQVERQGEGSAVGLIAGGVVGGLLGNQVGGGTGKDLATIAGAAGGAYAGREVEKRVNTRKVWVVQVTYPNGEKSTYEFTQDPGFRVGDSVKKSDKTVVRI